MRSLRNTLLFVLLAALLGSASAAPSDRRTEPLHVVATIEDLGSIVRAIGGERVDVLVLAQAGQNLHAVRVKPSHLVAVSKADLFVQVGLSLEHAWVPGLLESARNRAVQPGGAGFVDAGAGFAAIDVPVTLDRSQGTDVHPEGNPHVNLSADGGPWFAERILAALVRFDRDGAALFAQNHAAWLVRYQKARAGWDELAALVARAEERDERNLAVGEYHREFDYLVRFLGIDVAATIESKPGVPPTPAYLRAVIDTLRSAHASAIVTAPWSNDAVTRRVAEQVGVPVLVLPLCTPTGEDWIANLDRSLRAIAAACGVSAPVPVEGPS